MQHGRKPKHQGPLLALDAGTSSTGWAAFGPDGEVITSTIGLPRGRSIDTQLTHLAGELDTSWMDDPQSSSAYTVMAPRTAKPTATGLE